VLPGMERKQASILLRGIVHGFDCSKFRKNVMFSAKTGKKHINIIHFSRTAAIRYSQV
jgi:hypothetical protein